MVLPVLRRYTAPDPTALNVFVNAIDDESQQSQFLLLGGNSILDFVNDPDPTAATERFEIRLSKNGTETQVRTFSSATSPTTAGRTAIGPVSLSAGNYIWKVAQRGGTPEAFSFVVKYARPLN